MSEEMFIEECKKVGIKNPHRMKNNWRDYYAVFQEQTQNGKLEISVKAFHLAIGSGEYRAAKAAYQIMKKEPHSDFTAQPSPIWFQQFVAKIADEAQELWSVVDKEITKDVTRKVEFAEAAKNKAEQEHEEASEYLDEILMAKEELEANTETLIGYRSQHIKLEAIIAGRDEEIRVLKNRLEEADATSKELSSIKELLSNANTEIAKLQVALELREEQLSDFRNTFNNFNNTAQNNEKNLVDDVIEECNVFGDMS